jgi:putative ABC transport system substrate-binding protein
MDYLTENRKQKTENRIKRLLAIVALGLAWGCPLMAPGPVCLLASPDSPRMQQAIAGFRAAWGGEPLDVALAPQFGLEGPKTLRHLLDRRPRLLVVFGAPALMWVPPVDRRTPTVFAVVADPYYTNAAWDPADPAFHQENITGIASPPPVKAILQQGASLLGLRPWGLLYDPNDGVAADLARQWAQEAPRHGIQPMLETSAHEADDAPGLARLMARGAQVLFIPPTASAGRYADSILELGRQKRVMVISGYPEGPHQGAALWIALDYRQLGEAAAALAKRVLAGDQPARIPIMEQTPLRLEVDDALLRHFMGYPPPRPAPLEPGSS